MKATAVVIVVATLLFTASPISAQTVSQFTAQWSALVEDANAWKDEVRAVTAGGFEALSLMREGNSLLKRCHRLQEEASQANLDYSRAYQKDNRTLLLIASAAEVQGAEINLRWAYLSSGDPIFLSLANQTVPVVNAIVRAW